jgi:hypothetical protein
MIKDDACSMLAGLEPLAGSAPIARAWLVVEHPGPWGRQALTDSGIPDDVVAHISHAETESPLRFLAARQIDHDRRHASPTAPRRVWLAHCSAEEGQTRTTTIDSLEQLLDWDLSALADGDFPITGDRVEEPIEFICTHSKRDSCCAVLGRERIASVPPALHKRVWECSHLGGHRFAATSLFLPSGRVYGRLSHHEAALAGSLKEPNPLHLRGPSYLPPALQAAETAVRIDAQLSGTDAISVVTRQSTDRNVEAQVTASNGQTWLVVCEADAFASPASCGALAEKRTIWRASIIEGSQARGD